MNINKETLRELKEEILKQANELDDLTETDEMILDLVGAVMDEGVERTNDPAVARLVLAYAAIGALEDYLEDTEEDEEPKEVHKALGISVIDLDDLAKRYGADEIEILLKINDQKMVKLGFEKVDEDEEENADELHQA